MSAPQDITPDGSVVPVYRDPDATPEPVAEGPADTAIRAVNEALAGQRAGVERLLGLGIPESEARAIVGYDGPIGAPAAVAPLLIESPDGTAWTVGPTDAGAVTMQPTGGVVPG